MNRCKRIAATLSRRLSGGDGGFGLIELVIALSVLSIGIVSVSGLFVTGHLALRRASQADSATVLADKLLERFRAETWDTISLSSALVASTDSIYQGDQAYAPTTAITDSSGPCSGSSPSLPVACKPSRSIPDPSQTPVEVAPDSRQYRLDTYVNWGCADPTETLDTSTSPPSCTIGGVAQPYAQVKVVTIVVRDATSSATLVGTPVYRVSSTFDRLSGGSMPTVTVTPTTPGSTTTSATTTTVAPSGSPNQPTSVTLANGGGSGNAYINAANATSLGFDVALPSSSVATDIINLTVSDGNPAHDQTLQATGTTGAGVVHFTGINGQAFSDGTITFSATASNANGTSNVTSATATKDTVAPDAPTSVALQNGQGSGNSYINSANVSSLSVSVGVDANSVNTDSVGITFGDGVTTTTATTISAPSGMGSVQANGISAASLSDTSTITLTAKARDQAGNWSTGTTATYAKDVTAPTGLSVTSPTSGATGFSKTGPFTGTAGTASGDSSTVTVQFCQAATFTSACATTPDKTATATRSGSSWSVTLSTANKLTNGKTYTMRVVQQDAAGNTGASSVVTFTASN